MFGVPPDAPARLHPAIRRTRKRGARQDAVDGSVPGITQRCRIRMTHSSISARRGIGWRTVRPCKATDHRARSARDDDFPRCRRQGGSAIRPRAADDRRSPSPPSPRWRRSWLSVDAVAARQNGSANAETSSRRAMVNAKSPFGSSTIRQLRQARRVAQIGKLVLGVAGQRARHSRTGRAPGRSDRARCWRAPVPPRASARGRSIPTADARGSAHRPPGAEVAGRAAFPRQ